MNRVDLSVAQQHVVRAYFKKTGEVKYLEAKGNVRNGTISLVFKAAIEPSELVLKLLKPIDVKADARSDERVYSSCSVLHGAGNEEYQLCGTLLCGLSDMHSVRRVLINVELGTLEEYNSPNSLDPALIKGIVHLCKAAFPHLNAKQSSFNVKMGDCTYRFDQLLQPGVDLPWVDVISKFPSADGHVEIEKVPVVGINQ
ncbi:MAG: hypothetical protein JSS32_07565 [Verrucomicrobia bacterium]|nr:hypothetical protein [Verrucomicrobiota bacterium]